MGDIGIQELTEIQIKQVIGLIHKHTGMTVSDNKKSLIQGRIRPRMRALGLTTFAEYINYLEKNSAETQEFINRITTNETSFFRTPRLWEYFRSTFLPEWISANKGKKLNIWSGAASSGEEIYSTAMTCLEVSKLNQGFDFGILGTDISTQVLKVAERGCYSGKTIEGLAKSNPELLKRYFASTGDGYEVLPAIRSKVRFVPHNLLGAQKQLFDVVFLRNVLIYFETVEQETILNHVADALPVGGKLFIGESESLTGLKTTFKFVAPLVYEKRPV